jgi:hypothetical protein
VRDERIANSKEEKFIMDNANGTKLFSITDMYKLRVNPILDRYLKSKKVELLQADKERLLDYCLPNFQFDKLMEQTDASILQTLKYLMTTEQAQGILANVKELFVVKASKFDIQHKEALRLFIKEYFELFLPKLAKLMLFETAEFKDKELISIIGDDEQHRHLDALIMIQIMIEGTPKWVLIHWEQQSKRQTNFAQRMLHYFAGIYFHFKEIVFPIAMFTDEHVWRIPIETKYKMTLLDHEIIEFNFNLIKVKDFTAEEFENRAPENPLTWAYLPMTRYPKDQKTLIKAKALKGIAQTEKDEKKRSHLVRLVDTYLPLTQEEREQFVEFVKQQSTYQEVYMIETIKDVGIEQGEDNLLAKLIKSGMLTFEQIVKATGIGIEKIKQIAQNIQAEQSAQMAMAHA